MLCSLLACTTIRNLLTAYDSLLIIIHCVFFVKRFFASFCKFFKFFFVCGKIKRFVLKIHCLEANGKP